MCVCACAAGDPTRARACLVFTSMTWEGVGLFWLLLGEIAWAGGIRLVVRRGQEGVVDIG